ncbi:hypothetical protein BXP70_20045 [Hymenobacter crusticola]|uniref:Uncharacterized protein n=1 Tax=Hymenobacter crusticola TaxID=1770526 RepID=A0A243W937_9BACT|nr:hypothetical protein BXP70_20045 [Hymenobacter crusticola]
MLLWSEAEAVLSIGAVVLEQWVSLEFLSASAYTRQNFMLQLPTFALESKIISVYCYYFKSGFLFKQVFVFKTFTRNTTTVSNVFLKVVLLFFQPSIVRHAELVEASLPQW